MKHENGGIKMNSKKGSGLSIMVAVVAFLCFLFFLLTFGWVNVHPTEVAVEINKIAGKVSSEPLGVGYHIFNHWQKDMVIYQVSARSFPRDSMKSDAHSNEWNMSLKTIDGQGIDVDMTIIYSLNAKDVPALHISVGPCYEDQILLPQVRSEARIAIGQYTAEQMYDGKVREQIQAAIKDKLQKALIKYPAINIQDALMRDFRWQNVEFQKAIEQKKLASQRVEVNKNLALAQEQDALRVEAEARGLKLKAIQEAEGRGQSLKAEADGNAASIKVNADANRYKLEQEAAGNLARYKAEAEGKRLSAEALGGGKNVVALKFAESIPPTMKLIAIPVGTNNSTMMNMNDFFGGLMSSKEETK